MLLLLNRNIFSGVSIGSFIDHKHEFATTPLTVSPIPSKGNFPCDVLKKNHSVS